MILPSHSGPITGIDLGTTYSAIAVLNPHGRAEVVADKDGQTLTPSVVLFPPDMAGGPIVGLEAKQRSVEFPEQVVEFVKREMGDKDWKRKLGHIQHTPSSISAIILKHLLNQVQFRLGERPRSAVITCPAYFGDTERLATAHAGKLAGLDVLGVINEPTAAALSYGLHHAARGSSMRALVYDLGGGTFDVTLLELEGRRVKVLATAGEHQLGGKDWDDEVINAVSDAFLEEHGVDPRDDLSVQQDLRNRCEAAKVALSEKPKAKIFCNAYGRFFSYTLHREQFDTLTEPLLEQTRTYVDQVLATAGIGWRDLNAVLPVGGSSRMPQVLRMLEQLSGRKPEQAMDPELAVARGAAYYAALTFEERGLRVVVRKPDSTQPQARAERPATMEEIPMVLGNAPLGMRKPPPDPKDLPFAVAREPTVEEKEAAELAAQSGARAPSARQPRPSGRRPQPGARAPSARQPRPTGRTPRPTGQTPRPTGERPTGRAPSGRIARPAARRPRPSGRIARRPGVRRPTGPLRRRRTARRPRPPAPAEAAETLDPTAAAPQPTAPEPETPVEVPGLQGWGAPKAEPAAAEPEPNVPGPEAPVDVPGLQGWGAPAQAEPEPVAPVEGYGDPWAGADPASESWVDLDAETESWIDGPPGARPASAGTPSAQAPPAGTPFAQAPPGGDPFAQPGTPFAQAPPGGDPFAPAQSRQAVNPWADLPPEQLESLDPFAPEDPFGPDPGYGFMDLVGMGGAPGQRAIVDVNSRALAVLVHRDGQPRARVMIPANTPLPVTATNVFNTVYDNQRGVRVVVLEGDSDDPDDCVRLGECLIMDLPQRPKGHPIEIHYCYDVSGRVSVHARDQATGAAATIQFQR